MSLRIQPANVSFAKLPTRADSPANINQGITSEGVAGGIPPAATSVNNNETGETKKSGWGKKLLVGAAVIGAIVGTYFAAKNGKIPTWLGGETLQKWANSAGSTVSGWWTKLSGNAKTVVDGVEQAAEKEGTAIAETTQQAAEKAGAAIAEATQQVAEKAVQAAPKPLSIAERMAASLKPAPAQVTEKAGAAIAEATQQVAEKTVQTVDKF